MKQLINISTVLTLLVCGLVIVSPYLPSDKYAYFSYLPLLIPVCLVVLLFIAASMLLCKRWKLFSASILLLLASCNLWPAVGRLSSQSLSTDASFKVLSYNLSFFKIPSVFSKPYFDPLSAEKGNQMIDWILQTNAPVICLQEFFNDTESPHHDYLERFHQFGYTSHFQAVINPKNETLRGIVTVSRFPVVSKGEVFMSDNRYNGASFMDVLYGGDTVRIINVHLESMELYFGNKGWKQRVTFFLTQFKKTMITRTQQTRKLAKFIRASPYPVIVAGDFNETPFSYNHRVIKKLLANSFEESGEGLGSTFAKSILPVRIDHHYFGPEFDVGNFTVGHSISLSDHYPVYADYTLRK